MAHVDDERASRRTGIAVELTTAEARALWLDPKVHPWVLRTMISGSYLPPKFDSSWSNVAVAAGRYYARYKNAPAVLDNGATGQKILLPEGLQELRQLVRDEERARQVRDEMKAAEGRTRAGMAGIGTVGAWIRDGVSSV